MPTVNTSTPTVAKVFMNGRSQAVRFFEIDWLSTEDWTK